MVKKYKIYTIVILGFLLILYAIIRHFQIVDSFELINTNHPKTIYLIWRNMMPVAGNDATHAGFGDKIRGAIALYQYCRINSVNLKIDIRQDTSHYYLKFPSIETKYNDNEFRDIGGDFTTATNTFNTLLSDKSDIYCGCSAYPTEITNEDKSFAKYLLELTPEFKKEVDAIVESKLPNGYGIKHYRFKDELISQDMSNEIFSLCFNNLKNTYKETDVLMTNSMSFKKYVMENLKIKIIDCSGSAEECNIAHIGTTRDFKSSKFSYIEFFCICRATYIDTYSEYGSTSGFVQWPATVFDIPISRISL